MNTLTRRRLLWGLPLASVMVVSGGFASMLAGLHQGSFDPHAIDIPILNKPIPDFSLQPIASYKNFTPLQLKQQQKPILINFFASWCLPCVSEMPLLQELHQYIDIWGIAYKDKTSSVVQFLNNHHNPYRYLGQDSDGTTAINWGLSGVPESFLIIPQGIIKWHYAKPLDKIAMTSLLHLIK